MTTARHLDLLSAYDLQLVYRSQGMLHYTRSTDGGTTWVPYCKFARGIYPSLGQGWTIVFEPYIAFTYTNETGDTLFYRWYNIFTRTWS